MASNHVKVAGVSVKLLNDFIAKVQQYDGASELTVTECITQIIVPETFQTKKPYTSLYANSEDVSRSFFHLKSEVLINFCRIFSGFFQEKF